MKNLQFPQRIQIEVTNHCNYACIMCPRQKLVRDTGYMNINLYKKIIDECSLYKPMIWDHYLGEPLLHKALPEMLKYAKNAGLKVGFATNASLLDEAEAIKILDAGIDRVECSIDAASPETYGVIRKGGNLEEIEQNVVRFLMMKYERRLELPVVSVQFVKHQENAPEIERFVERWRKILKGKDFVKGIDFITWGGEIAHRGTSAWSIDKERKPCKKIWESLVILWDGTVIPCANDINGRMAVGNVKDSSIKEIWDGEEMERMRKAHLDSRLEEYGPCQGCNEWVLECDKDKYRNLLKA